MRIALARLLLSDPEILVLDEPTNHLDKGAKAWLAQYLSTFQGTLLVVSHDENLLKLACNSIAEVKNGNLELYKSRTHGQWLLERDERPGQHSDGARGQANTAAVARSVVTTRPRERANQV